MLVDFWAEWCGPCKQLTPVLEKAVKAAKGKVKLVKMDIDKHPAIPGQMGIQSIPAVIAFVNGQPADGFLGALPESQVADFIARITKDKLGGEAQDFLKSAEDALADGNAGRGGRALRRGAARGAGQRAGARAAWRAPMWRPARSIRRRQTLAQVPEAKRSDAAVAAARSALEVAEQAQSVGPVGELEQKVAANPLDHQARFDLAVALNAAGQARRRRPSICSRSSSATANGTTTARASSSCSSSRRGVRPTRRPSSGRRKLSSILFA